MSSKENNSEVAVEKATENDKPNADTKSDVKGTKRPAEVLNEFEKQRSTLLEYLNEIPSVQMAAKDKGDEVKKAKKEEENGDGEVVEEEILEEEEEEEEEGDEEGEDQLSGEDELGEDGEEEEEEDVVADEESDA